MRVCVLIYLFLCNMLFFSHQNDLGIKTSDIAAMTANLAGQGIHDVASIDATGHSSGSTHMKAPASASAAAPVAPMAPNTPIKSGSAAAGGRSNNIVCRGEEPIRPVASRRPMGGQSSIVFG